MLAVKELDEETDGARPILVRAFELSEGSGTVLALIKRSVSVQVVNGELDRVRSGYYPSFWARYYIPNRIAY